jgi:hypothetical protein
VARKEFVDATERERRKDLGIFVAEFTRKMEIEL